MKLPAFDYACPVTLAEAIALLAARDGEAKPLAGGQSLMPMMAFRVALPRLLVDLRKIPGLTDISISDDSVRLGAMVRWRDILRDARLAKANPLLVAAVAHVGHYQIRNRGTVGGSLAHADPAAEMPAIAITCDAEISAIGTAGMRVIKAADFFVGPLTTVLKADEIITEIRFPPWRPNRCYGFQEFTHRRGDFAMSGVALYYDPDGNSKAANAHVGVFGVADRPLRLAAIEALLKGRIVNESTIAAAAEAASTAVNPPDDIHASAAYHRSLTGTMVERALQCAARSS